MGASGGEHTLTQYLILPLIPWLFVLVELRKSELFSKFKLYYYSFKSDYKFFVIESDYKFFVIDLLLLDYFYPNSILKINFIDFSSIQDTCVAYLLNSQDAF